MSTISPAHPRLAAPNGDGLAATSHRHASFLRPGWPVTALFLGYPLWWILGFGELAPLVFAVPMVASLAARPHVRVPRGTGIWLLFLAWMLLSATQLDTVGRAIGFTFRLGHYVSIMTLLLYVYNLEEQVFPARRGLRLLASLWGVIVLGGWLAIAAPAGELPSIASRLLPGFLTSDPFVQQLLTPVLAQVHNFLGFPLPRPAAPFVYTNTWGATFALLLPFALGLLFSLPARGRRRVLGVLMIAATVPAVVSVNRGMWIAIVGSFAYLALRTTDPRLRLRLRLLGGAALVAVVALSFTPAAELVEQRLNTPHSNNARADVATMTIEKVAESPLLGYGAPRPFEGEGLRPPLGTQGQLWMIVFSHGLPALGLLVAWFVVVFRRVGRADAELRPLIRTMLVALAVVLPFYDLLGMPLAAVFLAAALGLRSADRPRRAGDGTDVPPRVPLAAAVSGARR